MSLSPLLVQCVTILRHSDSFGNTGNPHFFGIQFQNQQVPLRASGFAPPHFGTPLFPGNLPVVRFLSCPHDSYTFYFQLSWLLWGFRISGQSLWSSLAPMQLGAWRLRRCFSRRAPEIESFFESRESSKYRGGCSSTLWHRS